MFKIAILSKFPPLEGGIASKTYWLAKGLASRGYEVHVITHNASSGGVYNIEAAADVSAFPANLVVHRSPDEIPWHIPEDRQYALSLLDSTIRVVRDNGIQVLDSGYLVPFGIVGDLGKRLTGVSHVVRHGGSDMEKFIKPGIFGALISQAVGNADALVTEEPLKQLFEAMTTKVVCQPAYVPDGSVFAPTDHVGPRYRIAAIGKINYHWRHKSLGKIANIMDHLGEHFDCWMVGQGNGVEDFRESVGDRVSGIKWQPFVSPWEMPRLLGQLDAIFVFESQMPYHTTSNLVLEALCCGTGIVVDRVGIIDIYRDVVTPGFNQVLTVDPDDPRGAARAIVDWIQSRAQSRSPSQQRLSYSQFLTMTEELYASVVGR